VIAGNAQGFIVFRDEETGEAFSLEINNISFPAVITGATQASSAVLTVTSQFTVGQQIKISGVVGMTQLNGNTYVITAVTATTVTINVNSTGFTAYVSGGLATPIEPIYSPNHCLNEGDYIVIRGVLGTAGALLNGNIYSVQDPVTNGFSLNGVPQPTSGTYYGGGVIQRMYYPYIQTKQFPVGWDMARKTRIGVQQYLLSTTSNGQISLLIFLSQNANSSYNDIEYPYPAGIVPGPSENNSLIYSAVLYTCPESTNLGLTPANVNLQMPTSAAQAQTWHRMNTSLIGDTVQIGFTLNDAQMRDTTFSNQFAEIELHGFVIQISASQVLA
jgi:hypothetical protein